MDKYTEKCHKLTNIIDNITKNNIIVAFSGGVDSSLLLKLACDNAIKNRNRVYAVTIHTMMHSVKDLDFTKKNVEKMSAIHKIIEIDELNEAGIINNPKDRCYICKKYMFSKICEFAKSVGVDVIVEGTNFDDLKVYRPGIKALSELGIMSPLAEVGMTKEEVRKLAKEYCISASDKPSTPCYATRFEYGTILSYENIKKVEDAEEYIKSLGFYNVRLRVHGDVARIEVDSEDIMRLIQHKDVITKFLKYLDFKYVTIDIEGFVSGSMDR